MKLSMSRPTEVTAEVTAKVESAVVNTRMHLSSLFLSFEDSELEIKFRFEYAIENMRSAKVWLISFFFTEFIYGVYFLSRNDYTLSCPSLAAACIYLCWGAQLIEGWRGSINPLDAEKVAATMLLLLVCIPITFFFASSADDRHPDLSYMEHFNSAFADALTFYLIFPISMFVIGMRFSTFFFLVGLIAVVYAPLVIFQLHVSSILW